MQSPLSNFLLRPRSTQHRHRRSTSSPSSLLTLDLSPPSSSTGEAATDSTPPFDAANDTDAAFSDALHGDDILYGRFSDAHVLDVDYAGSHSPFPGTPSSHRRSFESPFPSPYSLNVPLSTAGAYLCTLTISIKASSLCLSGGLLYAALDSGDILVFKTPKLPECARFGIGSLPIKALLVTDNTIFSAHKDHKIRVWHRPNADGSTIYRLLKTLPSATDYLRNLILSKRYIQIRRHHKRLWIQHVDTITAMAIDSTSLLLYSASWDKSFKVWNLRNMRCVQTVKAHDDAINAIVVSPHSDNLIYTASADSTIKIWKKLSAKKVVQVTTLSGHGGASVNAMVMKADNAPGILYSGGSDCCVDVWQRVSRNKLAWKLEARLRGHRKPVLCLAVSGQLMCSGGADNMIRVWRRGGVGSYTCLAILQGHDGPVKAIAMAVSTLRSCYVYSASHDGTTKVWSVLYEKEDHESGTNLINQALM
ncbi:hypothetical protein GOP47_0002378 [Adiantum capillus-veneris]|uniref:Uncharacterized protein n=1 Tax=Adiantum capillus-veneris TaxID=13818 RepID=A0A9D4VA08_ADICA|nr:hypothetical protein GOP47_0002378 [Adiantum capillus-veneris]